MCVCVCGLYHRMTHANVCGAQNDPRACVHVCMCACVPGCQGARVPRVRTCRVIIHVCHCVRAHGRMVAWVCRCVYHVLSHANVCQCNWAGVYGVWHAVCMCMGAARAWLYRRVPTCGVCDMCDDMNVCMCTWVHGWYMGIHWHTDAWTYWTYWCAGVCRMRM